MKKVQAATGARVKPSERRVSETDPEARVMKQSDGGHAPSHHVQISTDAAPSIIVGVGVTQAASDQCELSAAVEEIERNRSPRSAPQTDAVARDQSSGFSDSFTASQPWDAKIGFC